jgi:RNA polymerase sigma factor (sigma-70 family)
VRVYKLLSQIAVGRRYTGMSVQSEPVPLIAAESGVFDLDAVFRALYPRIARVIARVVKDTGRADELSVEVFLKLSRTPRAQRGNVNPWLYRTAIRMALDELRKQSRREKYERIFSLSRPVSIESGEAATERQREVRVILASINKRSAEILLLQSEGFSYEEIALALGIKRVSIGKLISRAQELFRKEYIKRYGKP